MRVRDWVGNLHFRSTRHQINIPDEKFIIADEERDVRSIIEVISECELGFGGMLTKFDIAQIEIITLVMQKVDITTVTMLEDIDPFECLGGYIAKWAFIIGEWGIDSQWKLVERAMGPKLFGSPFFLRLAAPIILGTPASRLALISFGEWGRYTKELIDFKCKDIVQAMEWLDEGHNIEEVRERLLGKES